MIVLAIVAINTIGYYVIYTNGMRKRDPNKIY